MYNFLFIDRLRIEQNKSAPRVSKRKLAGRSSPAWQQLPAALSLLYLTYRLLSALSAACSGITRPFLWSRLSCQVLRVELAVPPDLFNIQLTTFTL
jgi:hypothetical protein